MLLLASPYAVLFASPNMGQTHAPYVHMTCMDQHREYYAAACLILLVLDVLQHALLKL